MMNRLNSYRLGEWFGEFDDLRREIDQIFEEVDFGRRFRPVSRVAFLPGLKSRTYPLVNLSEDNDAVYVEALAPGVDPDSLHVSVVRDRLTFSGEKTAPQGTNGKEYHRNERAGGKFVRTLSLSTEVDADKVTADYKDGILTITLPKVERAKPKQIAIGAN